jgi:taurine dioxygenase
VPEQLTITPMAGPFGAIVSGVDLGSSIAGEVGAELTAALATHHVLVIEGQHLSDESFVRFGRLWGEPILFFSPTDRHGAIPELIRISNSAATPEGLRDGAMHWHQDSTYEALPAAVTMLKAVEAPADRNATIFADLAAAYDALPEPERAALDSLRVIHDRRGCPQELLFSDERRGHTDRDRPVPTVIHPLVVRHPVTGRRALYGIAGTPVGIEGMPREESMRLLLDLKRHAVRPHFLQEATAQVGNVLLWDNLAVMHRATATEYSDADGRRRRLRRVSTRVAGPLVPPAGRGG